MNWAVLCWAFGHRWNIGLFDPLPDWYYCERCGEPMYIFDKTEQDA
jgi:hypothetical protein